MNWRKYHRVVSLVILLPLIVTTITGIVLLFRNEIEAVQPKSVAAKLSSGASFLTYEAILSVHGEKNIEQIILKPGKNNLAVRLKDGIELQLHPQTGEILKSAPRRTNLLIDFHQGSWLGKFGQYFIHAVAGFGLAFLIVSGLLIYPFRKRTTL